MTFSLTHVAFVVALSPEEATGVSLFWCWIPVQVRKLGASA